MSQESPDWKAGYDEGYRDGESSLLADVNTLCDQLDVELGEDQHEFDAIREEVRRLRRVVEADGNQITPRQLSNLYRAVAAELTASHEVAGEGFILRLAEITVDAVLEELNVDVKSA